MKIEKFQDGDTLTLVLGGWLDTLAAPELDTVLEETSEDIKTIVFECKELEYISSAGMREIVAAAKRVKGNLTLKNISPEIKDVLDMTGLSKRMKFE